MSGKRAYYPKRYTDWLKSAQVEALRQCGRLLWEKPVGVIATFWGARPNADIDNLLKSVLDALQGIIIIDDKQVKSVYASKQTGLKRTCVTVIDSGQVKVVYEELRE